MGYCIPGLSHEIQRLESGKGTIATFADWFKRAWWQERVFQKLGLQPVAWAIDTLLVEYEYFQSPAQGIEFAGDVRRLLSRHGVEVHNMLYVPTEIPKPSTRTKPPKEAGVPRHTRPGK